MARRGIPVLSSRLKQSASPTAEEQTGVVGLHDFVIFFFSCDPLLQLLVEALFLWQFVAA